jgi:hypothetical protein
MPARPDSENVMPPRIGVMGLKCTGGLVGFFVCRPALDQGRCRSGAASSMGIAGGFGEGERPVGDAVDGGDGWMRRERGWWSAGKQSRSEGVERREAVPGCRRQDIRAEASSPTQTSYVQIKE